MTAALLAAALSGATLLATALPGATLLAAALPGVAAAQVPSAGGGGDSAAATRAGTPAANAPPPATAPPPASATPPPPAPQASWSAVRAQLSTGNALSGGLLPVAGTRLEIGVERVGGVRRGDVPLVLIHDPGLDHTYFLPWVEPLASGAELVFFDQRGCGRSDMSSSVSEYSLARTAADVDAIRDSLRAPKIDVLGFSYGGFVALKYALAHPGRVRKLILVDTAPGTAFRAQAAALQKSRTTPAQAALLDSLAYRTDVDAETRLREGFLMRLPFSLHGHRTHVFMLRIARRMRFGVEASDYFEHHELPRFDVTRQLGSLKMPTLVLSGDDDILIPPSQSRLLASRINAGKKVPNATLKILHDAGHLCMIDDQKSFNRVILDFLSGSPQAPHTK